MFNVERVALEVLEPDDIAWLGGLLAHNNVWAGFGDDRRTWQANLLVAGLEVADLPAPVHALFWTSPDTRHRKIMMQAQAERAYAPIELDYGDPNETKGRSLKVFGWVRQVTSEELPSFLGVYNGQRQRDSMPQYSLADFQSKAPRTPDDDIAKELYVAGLEHAETPASWLNTLGKRRRQGAAAVSIGSLLTGFHTHEESETLRFNR
jgi:hypothetical protein